MTKLVRIENADTSDHPVRVRVFDKNHMPGGEDFLAEEITLRNPTEQAEVYIHGHRYLVVDEG